MGRGSIKLLPNVSLISKNHVIDFILQNRSFSSFKRGSEFKKDLIVGNALDEAAIDEYITLYNGETEIKNADEYQAREKEEINKYYPVKRDYLQEKREQGATAAALEQYTQEMKDLMALYQNPFVRFGMTVMEILPVGAVLTLLSAALLRKKAFLPKAE